MNPRTLSVSGIIRNGYATGIKNAASLVGAVLLWSLTCWIPYLNVGTTIGLLGLIAAMSKGDVIRPTAIFRAEYRKQMGEFFLVAAFIGMGVVVGGLFLLIPGIVIGLSWSLAPLLVIDRGMNPTEALQKSNDLTAGRKWTILLGNFLATLTAIVAAGVLASLGGQVHFMLGGLLGFVGAIVAGAIAMGSRAYVYGVLTEQRPEHVSDSGSKALTFGALAATVAGLGLMAVLAPSMPSTKAFGRDAFAANDELTPEQKKAADELTKSFAALAEQKAAAPAVSETAVVDKTTLAEPTTLAAPEPKKPVLMPQIQAPLLAADFMVKRAETIAAYEGNIVEVSGLAKSVKTDPLGTTITFEVPSMPGKFADMTATVEGKTSVRRGQPVTVRGTAHIIDFGEVSVLIENAEVLQSGKSVAFGTKKRGGRRW